MKESKISNKVFRHWNKFVSQKELNLLDDSYIVEMCKVTKKHTGLPHDLWISSFEEETNTPQLKILINNVWVPVEISDNPRIVDSSFECRTLEILSLYIKVYKEVLLAYYYKKIDDTDVLSLLKTLKYSKEAVNKLHSMLL